MLAHELELLLERLDVKFGSERTFFAFADTVSARSFRRHDESHGWMGIRFQSAPRGPLSEIIIHVRMLDAENLDQQEAIGIVGVNLIHGAFFLRDKPESLIASLMDDLAPGRIEVDMIRFDGPDFEKVDNRIMSLQLVTQQLTRPPSSAPMARLCRPRTRFYKSLSSSSAAASARSLSSLTTCSTAPAPTR